MLPKIKYQQLTYTITAAGQQVVIDVETDKLYKVCTGINVLLSDDTAKFSTFKLDVNNNELFPEKFEVVRLLFRGYVPFGFEYHLLNEPAAGSKFKGTYTDQGISSYPYNLTISLRLENKEITSTGTID